MKEEEKSFILMIDELLLFRFIALMSDLCREGNYCHSNGQRCSHGDDDGDCIVKGGNGSHHVGQTQGDQNLCGGK